MKYLYKLIFFLPLLITSPSVAQGLSDIEKDSIVKIENTDLSLIYYKKTTAVWHNFANFYIVEPTKNWFVYLHSAELLIEVDYKHKTFYAVVEDELTGGYKRFLIGENEMHGNIVYAQTPESKNTEEPTYKEYILIDTSYYSLSLKQTDTPLDPIKVGEYDLNFDKKLLFKLDYRNSYEFRPYGPFIAIESIEYPGEDSITDEGYTIYPAPPEKSGHSNSGVFNIKKREWLLAQKFNTINHTKSELITNATSTDLRELNSQIWRKKHCKWELKSATYSSLEKVGSFYICTTQLDEYGQFSYLILDKDLKPIEINDFYNFDLVETLNNGIKIIPILAKPTTNFVLDLNGNIVNSNN